MRRTPQSSAHGVGDPARTWEGLTAQFVPLGDGARALGLRPGQLVDAARRHGLSLLFVGSGGQRTRVLHLHDFEQLAAALADGRLGPLHARHHPPAPEPAGDPEHPEQTHETEKAEDTKETKMQTTHEQQFAAPYVAIDANAAVIAVTDDAPTKISLAEAPVSIDTSLLAKLKGELEIMREAYQEQIAALHASQNQAAALARTGNEFERAAAEAHDGRTQFERELVLARGRIEELEERCSRITVECDELRAADSPETAALALRAIEEQRDDAAAALAQERQKCQHALEELGKVRTEGTRLGRELRILQEGYKSQMRQLEASHDVSGRSERALRDLRVTSQRQVADLDRVLANERSRAAAMERSLVEREDEVARLTEELHLSETVCHQQSEDLTTGSAHATETREQLSRMSARAQAAMTRVSDLQQDLAASRSEAEKLASRLRVEEVKRTVLTRRLGEAAARLRQLHAIDLDQVIRRPA